MIFIRIFIYYFVYFQLLFVLNWKRNFVFALTNCD